MENTQTNKPYGFIYKTILPNGKYYIGQHKIISHNTLDPSYVGSGLLITAYIKKHGKGNITREIIEYAYSRNELDALEYAYINEDILSDPLCMNLDIGGKSYIRSEEINKKIGEQISVKRKQNPELWPPRKGAKNNKSVNWKIISPNLEEYIICGGLREFCLLHGLSYATLTIACRQGWIPSKGSCKGWQLINLDNNTGTIRKTHNKGEYISGKNNPMYNKKHSDAAKNSMSAHRMGNTINTKTYLVTHPDGYEFVLNTSMKDFCDKNNLPTHVIAYMARTGKSYKGWLAKRI